MTVSRSITKRQLTGNHSLCGSSTTSGLLISFSRKIRSKSIKKKSAPFTSALFLQFNRKMLAVLFSGPQCQFLLRTYFSAEVFCFGCLGDLGSGGGGVVFCMCVCLLGKEF